MNAIPYHLLALAVAVCWGLSVNSTKVLIDAGFGPWAVLALRTVLAYGLLIFLSPKIFYTNLRTEVKTALLGVALVPLAHGLQNLALASGQSSTTAVLTATAPIFTGLLAVAFFREFRFHWMSLAGTLAALAGAACLAVDAAWIAHLPEIGRLSDAASMARFEQEAARLNALPAVDYEAVTRLKSDYMQN